MQLIPTITLGLLLPLFAEASPPRTLELGIAELSCIATNGVKVQLTEAGTAGQAAKVVASFGFSKRAFSAVLEQTKSGQVSLALDAVGVNYKTKANSLDLSSTEEQVFSAPMIRYINAPVAVPVALLTCKIKLQ